MVKLRFTMLRWRVTCSVDWASPTPLWDIILNKKYFEVRMYHIVAYPNKRKTAGFELDILRFDILTMHLFPPKLENFYSVFQHKPFTSQIRVYIFSFSFFFFSLQNLYCFHLIHSLREAPIRLKSCPLAIGRSSDRYHGTRQMQRGPSKADGLWKLLVAAEHELLE